MKKERFKNIGTDIFQYGEWWCSANGEHCADVIATALNEVLEENEQLKKDKMILEHNHLPVMERKIEKYKMNVDALSETNDLLNEKIETLSDENEELKETNQELYDELQVTMSYKSLKNGEISILKRENEQLKKELGSFKPIIFKSDGKPVTLYKKGDV